MGSAFTGGAVSPASSLQASVAAPVISTGPARHGRAGGTPQPDTTGSIMNNTARRYGIPAWLLWGIFGAESSYGKSDNWFGLVSVPRSTYGVDAQGHHYDSGGAATFSGDADQAAATIKRLLSDNHGNIEKALQAYSGNGYAGVAAQHGLGSATAYIAQLAHHAPTNVNVPESLVQKVAANIPDPPDPLTRIAKALEQVTDLVTSLEFWTRLGEGLLGALLLLMGLRSLTGEATTPASVARKLGTAAVIA